MAIAAKNAGPGMDRAELKKALVIAKRQPMHCAFALGGDGKAVIVIDKIKKGPGLDRDLKTKAPNTKNHRFGTVEIDEDNPRLARFIINKAGGGGMARKLVIALKGTGFSKVHIQLEDGTVDEVEEDEDAPPEEVLAAGHAETEEDEVAEGEAAKPAHADASGGPATAAAGAPNQADSPAAPANAGEDTRLDAGSLTSDLTALVKQMIGVIAADPTKKSALAELATDAQASLKRGDLRQAAAGIEVLRQAMTTGPTSNGATAPGAAANGAAPTTPASNGATPNAPVTNGVAPNGTAGQPDVASAALAIAKARMAWVATRQKVEADLSKLQAAFGTAFKGHEQEDQLAKAFHDRVETVLNTLDDGLARTLDAVSKAKDPTERQRLVQQAHSLLQGYRQHVATDPTIAAIDHNPFVPMALGKTMNTTIDALDRSIA
jgi:hypothetical protein